MIQKNGPKETIGWLGVKRTCLRHHLSFPSYIIIRGSHVILSSFLFSRHQLTDDNPKAYKPFVHRCCLLRGENSDSFLQHLTVSSCNESSLFRSRGVPSISYRVNLLI